MDAKNSIAGFLQVTFIFLVLKTGCGPMEDHSYDNAIAGKGDTSGVTGVTVLENHPIKLFGQGQDPWGTAPLFNRGGCRSMSESGCTITTYAMLNSYYSDWIPNYPRDPGEVNDCLATSSYRKGCEMVAGDCLEPSMRMLPLGNGSLKGLRSELDQGYPVIARVRRATRPTCHHSVLVVGYDPPGRAKWSFTIFDPAGQGSIRRLSHYTQVCYTQRFRGEVPEDGW